MSPKIKKGLTLVELIIAMAILLIVTSVTGMAFSSAMESFTADRVLQDTEYDARLALLSITRDIRQSEFVEWDRDNNSIKLKPHKLYGEDEFITYTFGDTEIIRVSDGTPVNPFFSPPNLNGSSVTGLVYKNGKFVDPIDPGADIERLMISISIANEFKERAHLQEINTTISVSRIPK